MYKPLPDEVYLKESEIHGTGLFAKHIINSGVNLGMTHVYDSEQEDSRIRTPLGGFINHSENPNCFINENIHYHNGQQRELYTIRPIQKGEELTVYYTKGYDDIQAEN